MSTKPTYEELEKRVHELESSQSESKRIFDALKQKENRYQNLFQHMLNEVHVWKLVFDDNGHIKTWKLADANPAALNSWNKTLPEIVGKTTDEIFPDSNATELFMPVVEKIYRERTPHEWEVYFPYTDQFLHMISVSFGEYFISTGFDITERKRSEETLRKSEKDLRKSQQIAHLGSWRLDLATNQVEWTKELYHMYGLDPALPPPPYTEHMKLFTPKSWERLSTSLSKTRETGIPYELELETVRSDGSNGWMWVRGETISDAAGKTIGLWGAAQDITDRKRIEGDLRISEQKFRHFVSRVPGTAYQFAICENAQIRFDYMEPSCIDLFGFSAEEILEDAELVFNLIPQPDAEMVKRAIQESAGKMEPYDIEHRVLKKNGELAWIHASSLPREGDDGCVIWDGIGIDITKRKLMEEALKESEKKFRSSFENSAVGMAIIDRNGNFISTNRSACSILGYTEEEIFRLTFLDITHKDDLETSANRFEQSIQDKKPYHIEKRYSSKDGSLVWGYTSVSPVYDSNDEFLYAIAHLQDITEEKRTLLQLEKRNTDLRLAQRIASIGTWTLDPEIGVPEWTDEIYRIYERDPKYGPHPFADYKTIYKGRYWERFNAAIQGAIKNGTPYDIELKLELPSGNVKWVHAICEPETELRPKGRKLRGTIQDITERKRAEEKLEEERALFRTIVDKIPVMLTRYDPHANMLFLNSEFERKIGWTKQEVKTVDLMEKIYPDPKYRQEAFEYMQKATSEWKEFRVKSKAGDVIESEWSNIRLKDGTQIGIGRDITERKRMEAELQQAHKMEAIGNLAGGIAHEFNNVLGIILGNAELAIDDVPDWNPAKESLKEIRKASFRAKEVVRQILSFARKTMTSLTPLEINTIVKESLKLMRASIPAMVDIQLNIPSVPSVIHGDPTEIHQIVINLCTNAAHAMKDIGGVLEVGISEVTLDETTASRYEELFAGDFVKMTVRDSGEGIAPDILEKVFEPYFTTKEFGAGSGMGLAVVYGLVKKCKGAIDINSTVDKGTTVEVLFPKIEEEAPAKEQKEDELPTGNERILLVDDDPSIVNMIRQMLERLGYKVTEMTDSTAALEQFKSTPDDFDLVITDMAMPNMSGDQFAAKLMKVRKDVPILLCTGHSDTIDEKKAKEIGIKGFAMKPLDKGKLARAVRAALEDR